MFHRKVPLSAAMMAIAVAATTGVACAGDVNDRVRVSMPLGLSAPAPGGFLEFCRRTPTQCMSSSSLSSANDTADAAAVSRLASRIYWQNAFARSGTREPASTGSAAVPVSVSRATRSRASARGRYDWSQAFAQPTHRPNVAVAPRRPELDQHQPDLRPQTDIAFSATDQVRPSVEADAGGISYQAASASEIRYEPTLAARSSADDLTSARPFSLSSLRSWALVPPVGPVVASSVLNEAENGSRVPQATLDPSEATDAGAVIVLDREHWELLNRVNRKVNRQIRQASDQSVFGQADYWQAPTGDGAYGDCEDYVLAKRQALIEAGVPAAVLSIAIVETRWGESHAVLLVAGDTGEVVLDSLSSWISRWDRVDYVWRERQAPGKVFEWVDIVA